MHCHESNGRHAYVSACRTTVHVLPITIKAAIWPQRGNRLQNTRHTKTGMMQVAELDNSSHPQRLRAYLCALPVLHAYIWYRSLTWQVELLTLIRGE